MLKDRLTQLRNKKGLLQKDLAALLNITTSAYGFYEQGKRTPDTESLKVLAEFYGVTIDYLLGRTDNTQGTTDVEEGLSKENIEFKTYTEIMDKLKRRLVEEGLINDGEPIPPDILDKIIKHGIEAATEIMKLKKEHDNS